MRLRAAWLLLAVTACASEVPQPPTPTVNTADALRERLPETIAGFRRGATTTVAEAGGGGSELAYATANRGIAGYVQLLRREPPLSPEAAEEELARFVADNTSGTPMHRRLRQRALVALPAGQPVLRCAELDGTFGRQPVESLACAGVFGGQLMRLRLSHVRRDGRMAEARGFAEGVAAALAP